VAGHNGCRFSEFTTTRNGKETKKEKVRGGEKEKFKTDRAKKEPTVRTLKRNGKETTSEG